MTKWRIYLFQPSNAFLFHQISHSHYSYQSFSGQQTGPSFSLNYLCWRGQLFFLVFLVVTFFLWKSLKLLVFPHTLTLSPILWANILTIFIILYHNFMYFIIYFQLSITSTHSSPACQVMSTLNFGSFLLFRPHWHRRYLTSFQAYLRDEHSYYSTFTHYKNFTFNTSHVVSTMKIKGLHSNTDPQKLYHQL